MSLNKIYFVITLIAGLSFVSCKNSTGPGNNSTNQNSGVSSSDFALSVGREWDYKSTGYDANGNSILKSTGTGRVMITSPTNSNGLNGFKVYEESKDWQGNYLGNSDFFLSTENSGLWTLEKLNSGSYSPVKIIPFSTNSAVMRSDIVSDVKPVYNYQTYQLDHYEDIQITINVNFKYLGTENVTTNAGTFNSCKKIRMTIDVSQISDTNGVTVFNGKTWNAQSIWWVSPNNGLIKTENSFYCIVDSVKTWYYDPNSQQWEYGFISVLDYSISYRTLYYIDAKDLMIIMSSPNDDIKIRSANDLKYLGKYDAELTSKNF